MTHARHAVASAAVTLLLALAASARAQAPAGTVATLQGRAESQRSGQAAWRALAAGVDVWVGERIRTAEASRVKLLMRDDSVITLGAKSELVIDQMVVGTTSTSKMDAVVGSVRAVVTERYGAKGSSFEVKTPTAVAGVRGTGFVTLVDTDGKRTRVIGLYDTTFVRSITDTRGLHEVSVGPGQITEILAGAEPTKPRDLAKTDLDALVGPTAMVPGAPGTAGEPPPAGVAAGGTAPGEAEPGATGTAPGGAAAFGTGPGDSGAVDQGSGDIGDPATPGPPGGGSLNRPDGVIDQPIDRLLDRNNLPPPPPPNRR
jgi:hypothetical protein